MWKFAVPRIDARPDLDWAIGIRLGTRAGGATDNFAGSAECTLLAMRRTAIRELIVSPQAQGFIRYSPDNENRRRSEKSAHDRVR